MSGGGIPHFMGNIFRGRDRQQQQQQQRLQRPNNNNNHPFQNVFGGVFDAAATAAAGAFQQQQFDQQQQQQQQSSNPIPPASARTLQQLPEVRVIRADLVDPANRECCICFEKIELGSKVARLPCAHLYHKPCIIDWLRRNCTCPTCRFELPTDDERFEQGRENRMQHRKPRFAKYQLDNLSVGALRELVTNRNKKVPDDIKDKANLIEHLIKEDFVEEIPPSETVVEYRMSQLQQMKISELKRVMNEDAGVFFEEREVLEKKDMIKILRDSGRLVILLEPDQEEGSSNDPPIAVSTDDDEEQEFATEEEEDRKPAAKQKPAVTVETVYSDLEDDDDNDNNNNAFTSPRVHPELVMEPNLSYRVPNARAPRPSAPEASPNENGVPSPAARAATTQSTGTSAANDENPSIPVAAVAAPPTAATAAAASSETVRNSFQNLKISEIQAEAREKGVDISDLVSLLAERLGSTERTSSTASSSSSGGGVGSGDEDQYHEYVSPEQRRRSKRHRSQEANADNLHSFCCGSDDEEEPSPLRAFLQGLSISELRAIARETSVELADVIEKKEIVDRLMSSWAPPASGGGTSSSGTSSA